MSIEWLRDLAIVILGLGVTLVAIFIGIIAFMFYRKVKPILESAKATAKRIDNVSACVEEEISRPLVRLAGFVQGMRYMSGLFSGFFKRK